MPQKLRYEFKRAYGEILSSVSNIKKEFEGKLAVAVGDGISYELLKNGINPKVIIIDHRINRKPVPLDVLNALDSFKGKEYNVENPSGGVTKEMWDAVKDAIAVVGPAKVTVKGEEDMAFLPAVLECKEGDIVLYGFFDKGFVLTKVNNDLKDKMKDLLSKFEGS